MLRTYAARHQIELALLRFAGVYGYHSVAGGPGVAVQEAIWAAMAGKAGELKVYESVDFVYVKDLANGIALAAHATPLKHQVYNLGSGMLTTVVDVEAALKENIPGREYNPREADPRPAAHGHHPGAQRPRDIIRSISWKRDCATMSRN